MVVNIVRLQVFQRLIYRWNVDPRASRIMIQIQEYVGCCGGKANRWDQDCFSTRYFSFIFLAWISSRKGKTFHSVADIQ